MTTKDELRERIEELEAGQAQLREQHEHVTGLFEQFKTGKISRRSFLTSVSLLGGAGWLAGSASAAPDWNNATAYAGTDAKPLLGVHASSGTFEEVKTERLANDRYFAGSADGSDADSRLDSTMSAASAGDVIHLEKATYSTARTISKSVRLLGTNPAGTAPSGTDINTDWTLSEGVELSNFILKDNQTITLSGRRATLRQFRAAGSATVNVNGDNCRITGMYDGNLVFGSTASGSIIDASTDVAVTDNGSNTIGDIA